VPIFIERDESSGPTAPAPGRSGNRHRLPFPELTIFGRVFDRADDYPVVMPWACQPVQGSARGGAVRWTQIGRPLL